MPAAAPSNIPNISPARLQTIIAGLWFCLFISALDTTIVTTALIKISSDFNALEQAAWLVTTYLLTIVFRAFQGIGGSGLYSLTFVSILKLIVPEKIGFYSGVISSVFTMSNLLGPLLGGIIADRSTWRWLFFMK
ncbi:hypothetical protein N0V87_003521 [Didymella glomerata]|uniref:Major facilitator superfamily (MFS) profile domain-containing protein n=1 Tax=Didymella glomerata TaxID=749621 RepID=A0A9W9C1D8_9PLEO|nr:hypothetical protein N0V87_003521 [Didymella glomerata]